MPSLAFEKCPLCGAMDPRPLHRFASPEGVAQSFAVVKCRACRHVFTAPSPQPALLNSIYNSPEMVEMMEEDFQAAGPAIKGSERWKLVREARSGGVLLDYGCGRGAFLQHAKAHGFRGVGFEPSEAGQRARQESRLDVHATFQEALQAAGSADIVTLWDVLEHVPDPRATLREIAAALEPGATLLLGVPNAQSIETLVYGPHWIGWWVPLHLNHFTAKSLSRLLCESRFEVRDVRCQQYHYNAAVSWQLLHGEDWTKRGVFTARPAWQTHLWRALGGSSPSTRDRRRDRLTRLLDRLTQPRRRRQWRSYLYMLAEKKP